METRLLITGNNFVQKVVVVVARLSVPGAVLKMKSYILVRTNFSSCSDFQFLVKCRALEGIDNKLEFAAYYTAD